MRRASVAWRVCCDNCIQSATLSLARTQRFAINVRLRKPLNGLIVIKES